jgi:hypothetical protein
VRQARRRRARPLQHVLHVLRHALGLRRLTSQVRGGGSGEEIKPYLPPSSTTAPAHIPPSSPST